MRNLGIVVFSSHTGLGYQSHRLTQFLKPERILLIDNSSFSPNKDQHPEWYDGFNGYTVAGFPGRKAIMTFLKGLTHLYVIENPLNWDLIQQAQNMKIKTFIASNYEFCDNLIKPFLPVPDLFLMPSHWKVADMKQRFGEHRVKYLPPPVFPEQFKDTREINLNRKGRKRFLHIVGTLAAADRNGTLILLAALHKSKADFELVIKSQHDLLPEYITNDRRVKYEFGSNPDVTQLYRDFDALIMPRRFGGLCLPMQEALMSGLPVIMSDTSPNNELLPKKWLVEGRVTAQFQTRTMIDLFETNYRALGKKLDEIATRDLDIDKIEAFDLGHSSYSPGALQNEYERLFV